MDWGVYNDSLVKGGEILLDFSVLEGWGREVKRMNAGRRDSRRNFNTLNEKGIEPIIKVRKNAVRRLRGWPAKEESLYHAEERLRKVEAEVRLEMDS